ncbi:hypothetical protein GCM10010211_19510 [Streptomyces albospinus]|uniref:Transcriptional regulator n=1 Tax=Streptomyces albospinus TaxID=285515 RepID=A0ABQ2UUP1_9ACTN|nr:hypothetical protein GCM10010211_19510 [Streptomyces albospinus]
MPGRCERDVRTAAECTDTAGPPTPPADRLVEVERRSGGGGPARTYYRPSEAGMQMLRSWSRDWSEFATSIGSLITQAAREES